MDASFLLCDTRVAGDLDSTTTYTTPPPPLEGIFFFTKKKKKTCGIRTTHIKANNVTSHHIPRKTLYTWVCTFFPTYFLCTPYDSVVTDCSLTVVRPSTEVIPSFNMRVSSNVRDFFDSMLQQQRWLRDMCRKAVNK